MRGRGHGKRNDDSDGVRYFPRKRARKRHRNDFLLLRRNMKGDICANPAPGEENDEGEGGGRDRGRVRKTKEEEEGRRVEGSSSS